MVVTKTARTITALKSKTTTDITQGLRFGRFPITAVQPVVEGGRFPAKALPGEDLVVGATVFREGHDQLGVSAVLLDPRGKERQRVRLSPAEGGQWKGLDRWEGLITPTGTGAWSFVIEAWHDRYGTWHHNAEVKVGAGIDVELMLAEGAALLAEAADDAGRSAVEKRTLRAASVVLADTTKTAEERLGAGFSHEVLAAVGRVPIRELVTVSERFPLQVERDLAGRGSWYEFFPRSEGAVRDHSTGVWTSGNFRTAAQRLDAVAEMGFDVIYLPPIHPIGFQHRKGRNNTLTPGP
ncbi:MAG: maltotransferase domain-containing protein, partial [Paenarthrobacter sp.]